MDGIHDMGGMDGFGPILSATDESAGFQEAWEGRVYALAKAMGYTGEWTLSESRDASEQLRPDIYLNSGYYERWLLRLENRLLAKGLVTNDELASGRPLVPARRLRRTLTMEAFADAGSSASAPPTNFAPALFEPGQVVRARNIHPAGHTRLPRYVRGRQGTVVVQRGVRLFDDDAARCLTTWQWLYSVRFDAQELWGPEYHSEASVFIDAFESYLESL